jgi:3-oxoacyl-[acyl-carrier-protein] synthase-1
MVFVKAHTIVSPLGIDTDANFNALYQSQTGLSNHNFGIMGDVMCSKFNREQLLAHINLQIKNESTFTFLEKLLIYTLTQTLQNTNVDLTSVSTLLVFSTTKGNIEVLENTDFDRNRVRLGYMAQIVADYFNHPNKPVVISNACISGVQAISYATVQIQNKAYKNVIVCGGDLVSNFVVSGFNSFQALDPAPCKPFDTNRSGLNLGEACACIVLSDTESNIEILAGASTNDANHLSGPSRTGEGLSRAIKKVFDESTIETQNISFISAHGTATLYNDQMEALAFENCQLNQVPVNSFKGYFGHTLGAAGIVESIIAIKCLEQNILLESKGFQNLGVSVPLPIIEKSVHAPLKTVLKTASGFGGGNAALLISKI